MVELSIIIPAYNEEKVILNTINEVNITMQRLVKNIKYEIIVVDDGSTDKTFLEASKAGSDIVKIFRKENGGKGSALKFGFSKSKGRLVTFLDADLDLHPKQLPLFLNYMKRYDADIVIGSKRHPLSKINYPYYRKFLSVLYEFIVRILFNLHIKDTQAGFKLFKRRALEVVLPRILCKKFAFDLELLVVAHSKGFKIVEAPIELNWQRIENRIRSKDIFRIAVDTAAIFYRLKILKYYNGD